MPLVPALLFLVAVGLLSARGQADEMKALQVVVDASPACADADHFFSRVRARTPLVRRAKEDEPRAKVVRVRLVDVRHHVIGELRMDDDRGDALVRKLEGATCDDVIEALALTAAVALDPNVMLSGLDVRPDAPTGAGASTDAPAARSTAVAPPEEAAASKLNGQPSSAPSTARPSASSPPAAIAPGADSGVARASRFEPHFHVGVAATAFSPLSSGPSAGLALLGRWTPNARDSTSIRLRPSLGLAVVYVRNDVLQAPQAVAASLVGIRASVCALGWSYSVMTVRPCTSLMAGLLSARGDDAVHARSVELPWFSASAAARLDIDLIRGFALDVEAGISIPLLRREFYVTAPAHVVDRTSAVWPELALGIVRGF